MWPSVTILSMWSAGTISTKWLCGIISAVWPEEPSYNVNSGMDSMTSGPSQPCGFVESSQSYMWCRVTISTMWTVELLQPYESVEPSQQCDPVEPLHQVTCGIVSNISHIGTILLYDQGNHLIHVIKWNYLLHVIHWNRLNHVKPLKLSQPCGQWNHFNQATSGPIWTVWPRRPSQPCGPVEPSELCDQWNHLNLVA